jgi:hypothetical protein
MQYSSSLPFLFLKYFKDNSGSNAVFLVLPIPNVLWLTDLRACLQDEPYKIWFIETAQECKTTCAEEENCKMVKYSPEERKCYFSSSTKLMWSRDDDCMVKYDFYTKGMEDFKYIKFRILCAVQTIGNI